MTITCENPQVENEVNNLVINELQYEKDGVYIYHDNVEMIKKGRRGIKFNLWSAWTPDYEWLESLLKKYPDCWIKNEWSEEGGLAGVWIGFIDKNNEEVIKELTWDDICIEGKLYLFMDENEEKEDTENRNKINNINTNPNNPTNPNRIIRKNIFNKN